MSQLRYPVRRTSLRYSFFADAEVTLRDGTSVRGQLEELSARGCYIDTLQPIPPSTKLNIRICDGTSTCEVHGKVLYLHSGGGLGVFIFRGVAMVNNQVILAGAIPAALLAIIADFGLGAIQRSAAKR